MTVIPRDDASAAQYDDLPLGERTPRLVAERDTRDQGDVDAVLDAGAVAAEQVQAGRTDLSVIGPSPVRVR